MLGLADSANRLLRLKETHKRQCSRGNIQHQAAATALVLPAIIMTSQGSNRSTGTGCEDDDNDVASLQSKLDDHLKNDILCKLVSLVKDPRVAMLNRETMKSFLSTFRRKLKLAVAPHEHDKHNARIQNITRLLQLFHESKRAAATLLDITGDCFATRILQAASQMRLACISGVELKSVHMDYMAHLLQNLPNLSSLVCRDTSFAQLNFKELTNLTKLVLSHCSCHQPIRFNYASRLRFVLLMSCKFPQLNIDSITECTELECLFLELPKFSGSTIRLPASVHYAALLAIEQQFGIESAPGSALAHLTCFSPGLQNIDVSSSTSLESLTVLNSLLRTLDLSSNTALKILECIDNEDLQSLKLPSSLRTLMTKNCPNLQLSKSDMPPELVVHRFVH